MVLMGLKDTRGWVVIGLKERTWLGGGRIKGSVGVK